jgi:hypothetical protein
MANIIDIQTLGETIIASVDVNPSLGLGTDLPVGSFALAVDGSGMFYKNSSLATDWSNNSYPKQIGASVNGLGSAIQVGSVGFSIPSFSGNITSWSLVGDVVGDVVFDVKVGGVSIIGAGNKPTIVAGLNNSANISGWTSVAVVAGTYIEFVIESVNSFKNINLVLNIS